MKHYQNKTSPKIFKDPEILNWRKKDLWSMISVLYLNSVYPFDVPKRRPTRPRGDDVRDELIKCFTDRLVAPHSRQNHTMMA